MSNTYEIPYIAKPHQIINSMMKYIFLHYHLVFFYDLTNLEKI